MNRIYVKYGDEKHVPSCKDLNEKDLVEWLAKLGITHVDKKKDYEYWYHSPINPPDKTPSFKIDSRTNRWYDFSKGVGGSLVDLGILLYNCSVSEFLRKFENPFVYQKHIPPEAAPAGDKTSQNKVTDIKDLSSPALINYLASRGIPIEIAEHYCKEVHYQNDKGKFYAIGFQNQSGGYELRSKFFKGGSVPKDITHIKNGASDVTVFEGFFSFLSFVAMTPDTDHSKRNYIILNSLTQFEKARSPMEQYKGIHLCLDRDKSGLEKTAYALKLSPKYTDYSGFYEGYKDCNKCLIKEPIFQEQVLERKMARA